MNDSRNDTRTWTRRGFMRQGGGATVALGAFLLGGCWLAAGNEARAALPRPTVLTAPSYRLSYTCPGKHRRTFRPPTQQDIRKAYDDAVNFRATMQRLGCPADMHPRPEGWTHFVAFGGMAQWRNMDFTDLNQAREWERFLKANRFQVELKQVN